MRIDELRLDELTGYRGNPIYKLFQQSKSIEQFAEFLRNSKYSVNKLGQGEFGIVFSRPNSDHVYKVFTTSDKGYLSFLKYAKKNQGNPHLPRIYGGLMKAIMPLNNQRKDWYIVRLENLQEIDEIFPDEISMKMYLAFKPHLAGLSPITDPKEPGYNDPKQRALRLQQEYPQLTKVLDWIYDNEDEDAGMLIDLHSENIMRRGNTVVIIDPFSYFNT